MYGNTVDFEFETFGDVSLTEDESCGVPLNPVAQLFHFQNLSTIAPSISKYDEMG